MRWWTRLVALGVLSAGAASAGPVDFGMAELNAAIDARNFKYKPQILAELDIEAPETFHIEPYAAGGGHITGGDLRGLMYGLLEAAEQMRSTGRLKATRGVPALALRGVRITARPRVGWFGLGEFWDPLLAELARSRFNRLEVAFESVPDAETYPAIRNIAHIAQQYGVDVAIGFGAPNVAAIRDLLRYCPTIRALVLHGNAVPDMTRLLPVLHDAGRRVVLELPDSDSMTGAIETAGQSGAPLRLFSVFSGPGTVSNPRPRDSYWEMDAAEGAEAVNSVSGAGFEVGSPLDETGEPDVEAIAAWGRSGYSR